jgi:hypothetical protein
MSLASFGHDLTRVLLAKLLLRSGDQAIVMLGVLQVAFRCD